VWFRTAGNDYWFGLYKLSSAWYDGNPSTYRNWVGDEPDNPNRCIVYTADGFDDKGCNEQHYYTCKKGAGSLSVFVINSV